ncbi:hypothetical protein AL755_05820 [Arthrobacter sp. ERGS1:01]|uniref:TIGR03089 family protein n=1 Tax=Arthrobacter sp. ERGS1:01 TaxID=1704044 RepID=UPI0006B41A45|nr:TIGR03089 family protein [Arthrobacter sp. ERGS1:01]ALE05117.1 hypothetical protein AL755_05820 [Arthrobacter sp. ERGS1:01]
MAPLPSTVPLLLQALRTANPTVPRLTWYGPDSERVELSGRVLENWVAKTANFLVDELDGEPGTTVAVDMPVHWRSLVWLLATWAVGGTALSQCPISGANVRETGDAGASHPNIVATTNPDAAFARAEQASRSPFIVAVALPALAMRWTEPLPADALDYSGGVRAHADVFYPNDSPEDDAIAWESPMRSLSYAELLAAAPVAADGSTVTLPATGTGGHRVLLAAANGWDAVVPAALQTWADGGSVVLLDPSVEATEHLRTMENVTN